MSLFAQQNAFDFRRDVFRRDAAFLPRPERA
jgi:hypothetical protein